MREAWTDGRLDDLNHRVEEGFNRVDADLRELRVEMNAEFTAVRGEVNGLRGEMGALNRTLFQLGGGMIATFAVGFAGLIATQL
jgi:hypothetical protein